MAIAAATKMELTKLLAQIPVAHADDRGDWLKCGMAIHRITKGDQEGFELWDKWSAQSEKYDESACTAQWNSFNTDKPGAGLGTLRAWAKGQLPPQSSPVDAPASKEACAIETLLELASQKMKLVKTWYYQDSTGKHVLCVARFERPDGKKTYRQYRAVEDGWVEGGIESDVPLYNLLAILANPDHVVILCEGEKAADAASSLGLLATASCQGADSAHKTDWTPLSGREVWVIPDNDDAGEVYVRKVLRLLAPLECSIKVIRIPKLPPKGDMVEFVAAKRTVDELFELADKVPYTEIEDVVGGPVIRCLADVVPTPVKWLWQDRIPMGRLTMVIGRQGEGKTFMTSGDWAARVTTGTNWPDGAACEKGSVIIITTEDQPEDTIRPRFDAHGGDVRKVQLLEAAKVIDETGKITQRCIKLSDIPILEAALKRTPDCKMVIVDPIGNMMGKGDTYRDNEVREVLAPVASLAAKYGVAVICVMHRKKDTGSNADSLALGSVAFTAIARATIHVTADRNDKERRIMAHGKMNLAKHKNGLAFRIEGAPPHLVWEPGEVDGHADSHIQDERNEAIGRAPKMDEAVEWLRQIFSRGEKVTAKSVREEAADAGFRWPTIERAAAALKVKRVKEGDAWTWELPKEQEPQDGQANSTN